MIVPCVAATTLSQVQFLNGITMKTFLIFQSSPMKKESPFVDLS